MEKELYYEDLLGVPYKAHGRSKEEGFDCYGLVIEMTKRQNEAYGTPVLKDMWYGVAQMDSAAARNDYIEKGLNLEAIDIPEVGCVVEMEYGGNLHCGVLVDKFNILHTTQHGAKLTATNGCRIKRYYRTKED